MQIDNHTGRIVQSCGREYINFSTTSYLNLAYEPKFIEWYTMGIKKLGCSYGSSPLSHPVLSIYSELEEILADYYGAESAILFSSGYAASQTLIKAYIAQGYAVEYGTICHPSLVIKHQPSKKLIYASDIVDPIHCRLLDSEYLSGICPIVIDASHGFGVLDRQIKEHVAQNHILCGSLNKGLSTSAGIVLCTKALRQYLTLESGYNTSSAPSPAACFALAQAIQSGYIEGQKKKLKSLTRTVADGTGYVYTNPFPVLKLANPDTSIYQKCLDAGILIWHNVYPKATNNTVNRAVIHAGLKEEDISSLLRLV